MKRILFSVLIVASAVGLLLAGCSQAPPPTPTAAPAKPAATTAPVAPTAAPKAAEPTKPAAAPTAAPAAKVNWPEKGKNITALVGFAAGGPNDLTARVITPEMEKILGVSVQVVNKAGANEQVASTELVRSKPDGYTLQFVSPQSLVLSYTDPEAKAVYTRKDFAFLAIVEDHTSVMVVNSKSDYKTVKDMVDAAKAKPGQVVYATSGLMTIGAQTIYALQAETGTKFAVVNTDSGTASMTAVLGGHADWCMVNTNVATEQIRGGALRAVATTGAQRLKFLPDVPTILEQGFNVVSGSQLGVVVPAATPKEIQDILQGTLKSVMGNPDVIKKMEAMFSGPVFLDTAAFGKSLDKVEGDSAMILKNARAK